MVTVLSLKHSKYEFQVHSNSFMKICLGFKATKELEESNGQYTIDFNNYLNTDIWVSLKLDAEKNPYMKIYLNDSWIPSEEASDYQKIPYGKKYVNKTFSNKVRKHFDVKDHQSLLLVCNVNTSSYKNDPIFIKNKIII